MKNWARQRKSQTYADVEVAGSGEYCETLKPNVDTSTARLETLIIFTFRGKADKVESLEPNFRYTAAFLSISSFSRHDSDARVRVSSCSGPLRSFYLLDRVGNGPSSLIETCSMQRIRRMRNKAQGVVLKGGEGAGNVSGKVALVAVDACIYNLDESRFLFPRCWFISYLYKVISTFNSKIQQDEVRTIAFVSTVYFRLQFLHAAIECSA